MDECKAWAEEVKRRMGHVDEPSSDREEVQEKEFLEKNPKDRGHKGVIYKEPMDRGEMMSLIRFVVRDEFGKLLPRKRREKFEGKTRK